MNASFMESILFNPPRSLYRRGFTNRKTSVLNELNNLSSLTLLVGFLPQLRPGSTPSSCCSLRLLAFMFLGFSMLIIAFFVFSKQDFPV